LSKAAIALRGREWICGVESDCRPDENIEGDVVIAPTLGGSVPMYVFEDLGLPWLGMPIVNYDNHQHSSDENLRLGHFWRGMETYGALLAGLNW